jgi:hypothetical protein
MDTRRWLDRTQPQTLYIAVILLYINAVFSLLAGLSLIVLVIAAAQVGAGFGIANEKKWGYGLGILMAFLPFVLRLLILHNLFAGVDLITLMFEVALIFLLLHPQSRQYQRIWFK